MIFDAAKIIPGLLVFVGLATAPIWYGLKGNDVGVRPKLNVGTAAKRCVLPAAEMRATHMKLLDGWRDRVVRGGERTTITHDGRTVSVSLTGTCLGCHTSQAEFCDRCHSYAAVQINCFECHLKRDAAPQSVAEWATMREIARAGAP